MSDYDEDGGESNQKTGERREYDGGDLSGVRQQLEDEVSSMPDIDPKEEGYRKRYREIMEEQLDLIRNHNEFIDQQMDLMEEVSKKYDRLVHGFYDDYVDVAEGYTDLLSELSEEYSRKSFRETVGGFVLLGTGMTSAGLYAGRMNTSLVDLYTNPGNYSQDPEIFFWTAGVPLAGLYLFKRAYDHQQKADRYEEKINEVEDDLIS